MVIDENAVLEEAQRAYYRHERDLVPVCIGKTVAAALREVCRQINDQQDA